MEQLIRDLNSPLNQGRPDVINTIQRRIQSLQREPTAWQAGLDLLGTEDQLLQFYGALTIGLKVNANWDDDKIGENRGQLSQLIQQLVTRYVGIATSTDSEVVVSKLASILAAIFAKPDAAWAQPCRHVLACILAGHYVPQDEVLDIAELLQADTTVSGYALKAVLRLGLAISESAASNPLVQTRHGHHVRLSNLTCDIWQLLQYTFVAYAAHAGIQPLPLGLRVQTTEHYFVTILLQALQQFPFWAAFVASEQPPAHFLFDAFTNVLSLTIHLLQHPVAADHCMPCLTTLQSQQPRLLARAVPGFRGQVIGSVAASRWKAELLQGDFSPEANAFVEFLEAVFNELDTTTDEYLKANDVVGCLETAQSLLRCKGAAMVEDEVCQTILDMMTTIAEGYSDWSEPSQYDEGMTKLITDVCLATLVKVQYPPEELDKSTATWEDDDYKRFEDFRFQATDFFQTAFGILGPPMIEDLARSVSDASETAWPEFEAAIFVLGSVSDALSNEPERCDPSLNNIFSSILWHRAISASEGIPSRVRRSVITLLAETTSYLQRNPQYLINSLDFLFRSLQIKGHSNHAARAIYNLCDNQRSLLVQALPQFLQTLATLEDVPLHSSCKVLSAVSALVQALPSEMDKVEPLHKMLQLIQDLEIKHNNAPPTRDDEIYTPLFDRVSMLTAIARGLQSTVDTPIDLEAVGSSDDTFWTDGPGRQTQEIMLQMLAEPWSHLLESDQADLVSAACDLLKAGFKEDHPSPVKFSSQVSTELLFVLVDLKNPNLDQTMNTASCYVSSGPVPTPESSAQAEALITRVLAIANESTTLLTNAATRTTFSAPTSILDFIIRSLPKYGNFILTHSSAVNLMSPFVDYALILLQNTTDTLPRRSAAAFFSSFLELTDPTSTIMQDQTAAVTVTSILDTYSPTILGLTLHLLCGECARSEIESLSQLLRAFITKQPMRAKKILQVAMESGSGVLTQRALTATKPEQRTRFLAQIEALRGGRKTNEIVKDFWISCKGGQFGYVT